MQRRDEENRKLTRSFECLLCGNTPSDAHHMVRRSQGGDDSLGNLAPLCRLCHEEWHRGNQDVIEQSWVAAILHWEYLRLLGMMEEYE